MSGIWAHARNLWRWLEAPEQALSILENNEDIHSHSCGEYVLDQLQRGATPVDVVSKLLSVYLVTTTPQRVPLHVCCIPDQALPIGFLFSFFEMARAQYGLSQNGLCRNGLSQNGLRQNGLSQNG